MVIMTGYSGQVTSGYNDRLLEVIMQVTAGY